MSDLSIEVKTEFGKIQNAGLVDSIGTNARFCSPIGLAFMPKDADILFVCDSGNNCIRKIQLSSKKVTNVGIASSGGGWRDGSVVRALYNSPRSICFEAEDMYICDYANHVIRKIDSKQIVSTITGKVKREGPFDGLKVSATNINLPSLALQIPFGK